MSPRNDIVLAFEILRYSQSSLFESRNAGLAFGGTGLRSYRVRGIDGSRAKHLTVESYMVIFAANSYTYYYYYY